MTISARRAAHTALVATAILLAGAACGRRGNPRPPEDVLPKTIADLTAKLAEQAVVLSWSRPDRYVDDSRMRDLAAFDVQRSSGVEIAFERIAQIPIEDRDRFRQLRHFKYEDGNVTPGQTYRYRVISFTTDHYRSAPSNVVEVTLPESEPE